MKHLETSGIPNWCPGCGNFGIHTALKQAISELKLKPHDVVITSGIGCSSKIPHWIRVNAFNGLHGRLLPLAMGIKLANHDLTVLACGGDGDGYAEGGNHFIHFCRSNINITYIVHDNQIYGLTKGQASPTSDEGFITKTTPFGVIEKAVNPLVLALAAGATFVARGFAGDPPHLKELIKKAVRHQGAAVIDVLQPCVTWNYQNTHQWYGNRVYKLKKPLKTRNQAIVKAQEWGTKIPIGLLYQSKEKTYLQRMPQLKKPLIKTKPNTNIKQLLKELI
jgi:2-oxoglutarate ferredoxin oxidoreductase subunit beta